jgi:uracil-DNA glycosylase
VTHIDRNRELLQALDAHCTALAACNRCGHDNGVRPIVSIARRPLVMLVGQAPGKVEAEGGKPFAGRAGKTLFRWFSRVGVDETTARQNIYISAVTRCYPGASPSGRGDRVPSPAEQAHCEQWLHDELRIIRPQLLIPVGRLAITRFLPAISLEELIGREHPVAYQGGTCVAIPLPHPSGASSWIHQGEHPLLLDRALTMIGDRLGALGIQRHASRSVA